MKIIIFLGWLIVLLPGMLSAQEKVEAPVWNVGDKWVFDREGPMEVIASDSQGYSIKFLGGIFAVDAAGIAIFERSTLNAKYILEGSKRKEYRGARKKILNFPLTLGKQWKDLHQRDEQGSDAGMVQAEYQESFRVLGWDEVEVRAGKFKAIKLEYKINTSYRSVVGWVSLGESKAWYWYSPEIRNLVKSQYEKGYSESVDKGKGSRGNWELISYKIKK